MQPTTRGTVSSDGAARAVSRPVPVPARRLPARSHPRDRRRTVRHRVGADRGGKDARRRVRHPHGARDGQAHRVHHAAQGALNQKFNDFTRAFGADTVGILTGDVKVNPHGRVLVMTTEILRNALYGSGLDDLGYIVLDECHYMGDETRGTVWEEIIVNAPTDVLLVGLSATVANVKEIADWISIVHRPIVPIFHPHRSEERRVG